MKKNITIIDYGSGNILSAMQSFAKVIKINNFNAEVHISGNPKSIKNSSHIVLPGQGAFETCISGLKNIQIKQRLYNRHLQLIIFSSFKNFQI